MANFQHLTVNKWNQFNSIDIKFDKKVTILTGANGAGKTTILKMLALHSSFQSYFYLIPQNTGQLYKPAILDLPVGPSRPIQVASLTLDNQKIMTFVVPAQHAQALYQPSWQNMSERVNSIFIPSTRQLFSYSNQSSILTKKLPVGANRITTEEAATLNVAQDIKNKLLNWAFNGFDSAVVKGEPQIAEYFMGFQELLKQVLPKDVGFEKFDIINNEIVFKCSNGSSFLLESVSSGIGSLISIAWQLYHFKYDVSHAPFTVIIDEAEAHLHPKMQRSFLPSLIMAFPNANFIITTHSPLMINSVQDSRVYVLAPNNSGYIDSVELDFEGDISTANTILNEVLGVPTTYPVWVEDKLVEIENKYSNMLSNQIDFEALQQELEEIGLGSAFLSTMTKVMERKDD
ncbi:AAA family ATPase [Vibrio fluvialis]|nr:AAA family ATPase [Vibrio fluvialis]MBY8190931.1 AAA family ATPase [Vibrio fluvialis]